MRTLLLTALAAALAATACRVDRRDSDAAVPTRPRAAVLGQFWYIPGSRVTDTTGTPDAERKALSVAMPVDTVRAVYRDRLAELGWTVVSNLGDSLEGSIHARKDSALVWINLARSGPGQTSYTVIGARVAPDTTEPVMMPRPR